MSEQVATPESIRKFRDTWGLKQPQLARGLGLSLQTISRWERGVQVIANPRLVHLAMKGLEPVLKAERRRAERRAA
jgi:DNA-binding transcriptional regulator YiaG